MARQSLVWTALPNGYTPDGTGLRVSVMLSPRLDAQLALGQSGKLATFFPDWEDWPSTLSAARFEVSYGGQTRAVPATVTAGPNRVDGSIGLADSAVWKALFQADVGVKTFTYRDLSDALVLSYDALAMAGTIEHLYSDLARAATDRMPRVTELLNTERWRAFMNAVAQLDALPLVDRHTGLRDPKAQFDALRRARSPSNLQRFQAFHTPPAAAVVRQSTRSDDPRIDARWLEHQRGALPRREDIAETIDFHQIVAAMGSYPTLLRRLGLVVDLVLTPTGFTPSPAADLSVAVRFPDGTLQVPRSADGHPATRTRLTDTRFDAVPDPAASVPLADGLLDIGTAGFGLVQLDVDGAGLKAMNFARSLMRRSDDVASRVDPVTRQEDEVGAASLRTAGLMLVQRARGDGLKNRFGGNKARNAQLEAQLGGAPASVSLHAQDIVRGWRIDIWDSVTRHWHSLCRRQAHYAIGEGAGAVAVDVAPEEETTVRLAATRSSDPASNADLLYLHEALVSWTGWSLAARPPGRAIGPDDSVDKTRDESEAELPPGLRFKSSFTPVKASLPRLRFGRSYWMRARAVDLAGNSLAPFEKDYGSEQPAMYAQRYLRYEPVAAPVIALLSQAGSIARPREGESMARIAIRSFNETPADNDVPSAQVAQRVAAPAQASVRDAEQHGLLDALGKVDASLFDLLANQKDLDPTNSAAALRQEKLLMQGQLDTQPVETVYAVYEAGRALTYLPDALAVEVAVRVFDHPNIADVQLIRIPLYPVGAWPEARPFVIEAYEDAHEAPHYDAAAHRLRVPCPKAVRATLRLSMTLTPDALGLLGVFQWLAPADQAAQRARARRTALDAHPVDLCRGGACHAAPAARAGLRRALGARPRAGADLRLSADPRALQHRQHRAPGFVRRVARTRRRCRDAREQERAQRPPPARCGLPGEGDRTHALRERRRRARRARTHHHDARRDRAQRGGARARCAQGARVSRHPLPPHRVLAGGHDALSRIPAARTADHAGRWRARAERRVHQGHRRAPSHLGAERRTAAGGQGAVRGAHLRMEARDRRGRHALQLAPGRRAARIPRARLERVRLRRDAGRGAAPARLRGRSR
jgi:hypothetical protein